MSSFGFGGANYHITLEEVTGTTRRAPRLRSFSHELVTLHADSPGALVGLCLEMAGKAPLPGQLLHLAHQSQQRFQAGSDVRLAIIAKDERDLQSKLKAAAKQIQAEPGEAFSAPTGIHYGRGMSPGGIAFLFPGQGSQYIDMGGQLATSFSVVMQAWDDAAALDLGDASGLHQVVYPQPVFDSDSEKAQVERLTRTEWAQPAIGCTSLSMLRLLRTLGLEPDTVGGHSFGEVSALHAAGVLSVQDFLRVARKRGEMMARAARTPGAMTAVSHPAEEVQKLLNQWRSPVVVANINSPNQVVLSGRLADIEAVELQLKQFGLRFKRLPVATAFHSPVVAEASRPFGRYLSHVEFSPARVPVFANTTARPHGADAQQVRDTLAAQISHPVRFVEMIENMSKEGIHTFVEVGPGSVLTGLVGRILEERPHAAIAMDRKGRAGILSLWNALGRLAALGIEMDLSALWDEYATPADPASRPQPRMAVPVSGSNYGRPYPPPGGIEAIPSPNQQDRKVQKQLERLATMPTPSPTPAASVGAQPSAASAAVAPNGLSPQSAAIHTDTSMGAPLPESTGPSADWLQSFEEAQKKTAEAHTAYQQSMAEAHSAYLRTAEAGFAALRSLWMMEKAWRARRLSGHHPLRVPSLHPFRRRRFRRRRFRPNRMGLFAVRSREPMWPLRGS